jgi:DNA-binding LacI/PurR family transcriptional regulator
MTTPRRRPTIADVARRAGVSPAAVSFAVNDRPGVSPATRERILEAARELGWRPSASARALTEARTRAVGLVLAREPAQLEVDAFFVRFLSGVERTLAEAEYALLLQLVRPGSGAALTAYETAAGRVDGFLVTDPELDDPRFPLLEDVGLPVVIAGHPVTEVPFPWLETEHHEGAAAVVEHLAGLGHRRIGFFGESANYEWVQRRRTRYEEALQAAGLAPGPSAFVEGGEPAGAAQALVEQDATAVVCSSDVLALNLVAAALRRGLAVPDDLSVTGFDDSPLAALASPPLTSVRVDYLEFGAAAAALLLAAAGGDAAPPYRPSLPELAVRASTAAPRR